MKDEEVWGNSSNEIPPIDGAEVSGASDDRELLIRITDACRKRSDFQKRWKGDWTGLRNTSPKGKAFTLGACMFRAGFQCDEFRVALSIHPETREWLRNESDESTRNMWQQYLDGDWKRKAAREAASQDLHGLEANEDGIALAFTKSHCGTMRFDHDRGLWFEWEGNIWRENHTNRAFSYARELCRHFRKLGTMEVGEASKLAKASTAAAVERFAQSDQKLAVTSNYWDLDDWLLGTPKGTVNLRTGELRAADPSEHITKSTAVAPAEKADCPLWLKFLDEATKGDADFIRFLQQWSGYSLTGDTREHALLFVYGDGGNGKGIWLNTISAIVGDYARNAAMDSFTVSHSEKHSTDMAGLRGARMVKASEIESGRTWAEAKIYALTGGDTITARFMRQDFFEYVPKFKLTIIGNHRPVLQHVNDAAKRRFNFAPFVHKPEVVDAQLRTKLEGEWSGILRWMIDGCLDWLDNGGLSRPKVVQDATAHYFEEQNTFSSWLQDCCDVDPYYAATSNALFESWTTYMKRNGEVPGSVKAFSAELQRQGFATVRDIPGMRGRGYKGLRVHVPPDTRFSD